MTCPYLEVYEDGSSATGYFVRDVVQYDRVSGDLETTSANGSIIFGCVVNICFCHCSLIWIWLIYGMLVARQDKNTLYSFRPLDSSKGGFDC